MAQTVSIAPKLTREDKKSQRAERILDHARAMIAEEGFDALKIRELAARAELTVPTIYNLIGGKSEILARIIEALVERLHEVQSQTGDDDIEAGFEQQITRLADLFAQDEDFYRAAFVAGDRSGLFEQRSDHGIFARSLQQPVEACRSAQAAGLLQGAISAEQLGRQVYDSYRLARQDWANGYFDLEGFRTQALTGVFLSLAADAAPAFRERLLKRISSLVGR
ncbi:MAG: TetR/AcrR family transcriptional regulator [Altererythrobacter sp. XM-24bin4]|jgi:AcrR family transcriptional regulator|uniref:TetR/AcrR family transcriptional regulator n=1 Tax=uncultured Altererythrobacter sp. TaxID=500840 RepID=UPI000D790DE6|nr:TetR/AcrR family transcriptional regulator [uncultured Altererythrobacter sp.]PWL24852.1 MAG: TetR/AcrR family transcriptional regulator [Altererythrobacter sp. XM-24bin4]